MKKQIQLIGIISALLLFVGIIFKTMHWPGASLLMSMGAIVGIVYLVSFLIKGLNALTSNLEKNTAILGAVAVLTVLVSFWFKVLHWPAAGVLVVLAHVLLFISAILYLIDAYNETEANKQSLKSLLSFTIFILMSILVFLGIQSGVLPAIN